MMLISLVIKPVNSTMQGVRGKAIRFRDADWPDVGWQE